MRWNKSPQFIFAALLSSTLIACGGSSSSDSTSENTQQKTPAVEGVTLEGGQNLSGTGLAARSFGNLRQDGAEIFVAGQTSDSLSAMQVKVVNINNHPDKQKLQDAVPAGVNLSNVGDIIVLEQTNSSGQTQDFAKPVEVTVAVDFTQLDADDTPVVLYFDENTDSYSPVAIKSMDRDAGTITFITAHTSTYRIALIKNYLKGIDSGFDPSQDSFLVPDLFTFGGNLGGNSYGISAYVAWWYKQITSGTGDSLSDLFKGESTPATAVTTQKLFNQLYKGSYNKAALQAAQDLADQVGKIGSAKSQEQTGSTLLQMLQITEQPQLLVMAEIDNICVNINNCDADAQAVKATRTVAVYKYDDTTELFSLYDPNFPGEENTIKWTKADGFTNWSKSKSTSTQYNAFGFASSNTAFSTKTLRDLADKAKTELADTSVKTPDIEITEPVAADEVRTGVFAIDEAAQTQSAVRIAGKVTAAAANNTPQYVHAFLNGTLLPDSYPVNASDGTFTISLGTLPDASGTDVILFVSDNPNSWTGGTTAISHQLKIRVKGNEFFKNLGFETGELKDRDGNEVWSSYQYSWNNVIKGDPTGDPRPQGFTVGFDLETDATKPSGKSNVVTAQTLTDILGSRWSNNNPIDGFDPIATELEVPYYGDHALRINNSDSGYPISNVIQEAIVPVTANPTISFRWAAVLEDPSHPAHEQPFVEVKVEDLDTNETIYSSYFFANDDNYQGWEVYDANGVKYASRSEVGTPWLAIQWQQVSVPVAGRAGHKVKLTVTGASCGQSAHGGYVYLDAEE